MDGRGRRARCGVAPLDDLSRLVPFPSARYSVAVTTELTVQVIGDESAGAELLDELGQLAQDLRAAGPFAVRPPTVMPQMPGGAAGTAEQIGYLVVSGLLSATVIGAIRDVIVAYLARTRARAVRIKVGDREVTLDGASAADLSAVTKQLTRLVEDDVA
jgi:hypothetical protein